MSDDVRVYAFKALDINQEHWTMASVPCECGGAWRAGAQGLVDVAGVPTDEFNVECGTCGARARFRFDVSAFFAHGSNVEKWVTGLLPDADERVRARIARKVGPPLGTKFKSLVQGLANDADVTTLLYMRWQIDRAVAGLQQRAAGEEPQ
jgi:hypothetical protein